MQFLFVNKDFTMKQDMHNKKYLNELREYCKKHGEKKLIKYMQKNNYTDEHTSSEIAYIMGLTRERIKQIEIMATKKIKHPVIGRKLKNIEQDNFDKNAIQNNNYMLVR